MSQESVGLLGRMFALLSEEDMDWDANSELIAPDIVWEVRSDFPTPRSPSYYASGATRASSRRCRRGR